MAEGNPFAFKELNVPQSHSPEASLRAEVSRLKQQATMLQRKVRELEDANGIAQALAAAKNQAQEAQREMKRAQIAERIAREALDVVRNSRNMSQDKVSSQNEVKQSRTEVGEGEENRSLQVELETSKGLLDNASERLGDTSAKSPQPLERSDKRLFAVSEDARIVNERLSRELQDVQERLEGAKAGLQQLQVEASETRAELEAARNHSTKLQDDLRDYKDRLNAVHIDFDNHLENATEDANNTITELQTELQQVRDGLDDAKAELEQVKEQASNAHTNLETVRKENAKLDKSLAHQTNLAAHLTEINDNLLADLTTKEEERRNLARERDDFEVRLAETVQALNDRAEGETKARNELNSLVAETELLADGTNEQIMYLQGDIDTLAARVEEHTHIVAVRDDRIAKLERENEVLERKLEEEQSHKPIIESVTRPLTRRNVSTASHKSLAEELDLEDNQSISDFSDVGEPVAETVDLELSAVHEVVSISPCHVPAPRLITVITGAVCTAPRIEKSKVGSASSITPAKVLYSSIHTALDSSTAEPQRLLSHVDELLDYPPVEPSRPGSSSLFEPQKLSTHIIHEAGFSRDPISGSTLVSHHCVDETPSRWSTRSGCIDQKSSNDHWEQFPLPYNFLDTHERKCPSASSERRVTTERTQRRRSPLDPFARLPRPMDHESLDKISARWPVKDEVQEENPSLSAISTVIDSNLPAKEKQSSPTEDFLHVLEYALGFRSKPQSTTSTSPNSKYTACETGMSSSAHYKIHLLMTLIIAVLLPYCYLLCSQLYAWEHANGIGFGEGHGNVLNCFGAYGNGHVLLSMLPHNWLSADSPLPLQAVHMITSAVSVFEGLLGLDPSSLF